MTDEFSGKHVLVTGGSRGIGRAVCKAFADQGARVALTYLNNEVAARETHDSLPGGPHLALQANISTPEDAHRIVDTTVAEFGTLEMVVNNAGMYRRHRIDEVNYREWQDVWAETLSLNLVGAANVCHAAARHMIDVGIPGRIVNVSSRGAFRGEPDGPVVQHICKPDPLFFIMG